MRHACLAAALLACDRGAAAPAARPDGARRFFTGAVDTTWSVTLPDSTFIAPTFVVLDATQLYVVDAGASAVVAFDRRTGQRRWTTAHDSTMHEGVLRVATARRDGGIAYLDERNAAVVLLGADGRARGRIVSADVDAAGALCELPDHAFLLAGVNHSPALMVVDARGHVARAVALPWPDLRDAVTSQVWLAPTRDGCAATLAYGRGYATFADGAFAAPRRYVEYFDVPRVEREVRRHGDTTITSTGITQHRVAATDASVDDSTLAVPFDGESDARGHVVDFYAVASGRYLGSRRLGRRPLAYTLRDGVAVTLSRTPSGYLMAAWREPLGR